MFVVFVCPVFFCFSICSCVLLSMWIFVVWVKWTNKRRKWNIFWAFSPKTVDITIPCNNDNNICNKNWYLEHLLSSIIIMVVNFYWNININININIFMNSRLVRIFCANLPSQQARGASYNLLFSLRKGYLFRHRSWCYRLSSFDQSGIHKEPGISSPVRL